MIDHTEKTYTRLFEQKKEKFSKEFKDVQSIKYFISPYEAFRYRAEFSLIGETGDKSFAMTKNGIKEAVSSFPVASIRIQKLMKSLISFINENSIIADKLFQVEFQSSRNNDSMVTLIYHKKLDHNWEQQASFFANSEKTSIIGRSKKQKIIIGKDYVKEIHKTKDLTFSLLQFEQCFSQTNPNICDEMLNWVESGVNQMSEDVLELHCGLGTFTILLSKLFRKVLATENSRPSVKGLQKNLDLNKSTNVHFARMSGQETFAALNQERVFNRLSDIDLSSFKFSTIFLDPPREGLDRKTIQNSSKFEHIIYISCGFESFKRDLSYLKETHEIKRMAMFDQFPYTEHIESGAILSRKAPD